MYDVCQLEEETAEEEAGWVDTAVRRNMLGRLRRLCRRSWLGRRRKPHWRGRPAGRGRAATIVVATLAAAVVIVATLAVAVSTHVVAAHIL